MVGRAWLRLGGTDEGVRPYTRLALHERCGVTFVWGGYLRLAGAGVMFINISEAVGTEADVRASERGVPNESFARSLVSFACLPGIGLRRLLVG